MLDLVLILCYYVYNKNKKSDGGDSLNTTRHHLQAVKIGR